MRKRVPRALLFLSFLIFVIIWGSMASGKKNENFTGNDQVEGTPEFEKNVIESNGGYNRLLQFYREIDKGSKEGYLVSGISAEGFSDLRFEYQTEGGRDTASSSYGRGI